MGHLRATMGHLRLTIGYLKATVVRVTLGHFKVTIGYSISKHKANITELHPKVRQTCSLFYLFKVLQVLIVKFPVVAPGAV